MKQPIYIQSAVAISPQQTFFREQFLQPVLSGDTGKLLIAEPDYRPYINPVAIRRMSKVMKMAISCAIQALKEAGVDSPDGIITGTGRGSMTDMEHFLTDMIQLNEGPMNPTSFIQSTYNSPNGWIAMQAKTTAYNQTFVHRGSSLELALLDARLLLEEADGKPTHILTGCYDEITNKYFTVKDKISYWKQPRPHSLSLLQENNTSGTIGGEGAAFFTCSNVTGNAKSVIRQLELIQDASTAAINQKVGEMLGAANLNPAEIDLVLIGANGDHGQDAYYSGVLEMFGKTATIAGFKHLCGEFDTATGFGLWLSDWLIREQQVPEIMEIKKGATSQLRHMLLVNHYILGSASVMLISKVTDDN